MINFLNTLKFSKGAKGMFKMIFIREDRFMWLYTQYNAQCKITLLRYKLSC